MTHGPLEITLPPRRFMTIVVALLTAWASLACVAAPTRAQDVFTVENVAVDATAETAAAARERAMAQGQQAALAKLFTRLVPEDQRGALPTLSGSEVADLVRDFAVDGERASAVRYLARLTVRFRADDVRALLRQRNVPFAETMSKPIVVLPLLNADGAMQLWELNPWRAAWQGLERDGLVPFIVPAGDLDDVTAIDAARAQSGDRDGLSALAWRYKAGDVIVAIAEPRLAAGGPVSLQVTTVRHDLPDGEIETTVRTWAAEGGSPDALFARGAAGLARDIEESWKKSNLIRFDSERSLIATLPLRSLADLVDVRKRLDGVSFLRSYDLLYLSRAAAQLRLSYFGDERQLSVALRQSDLILEQDAAEWALRRSGTPRRPAVSDRPSPVQPPP